MKKGSHELCPFRPSDILTSWHSSVLVVVVFVVVVVVVIVILTKLAIIFHTLQ